MGLLSGFINLFRRIETRYSSFQVGFNAVYPDMNSQSQVDLYSGNASVYSIVNIAARKFSSIPRYLMKEEDSSAAKKYKLLTSGEFIPGASLQKSILLKNKAYSPVVGLPINNLLERPNPNQGQDSFFFSVYASYKLTGEAFVWLNRGDIDGKEDNTIDKMPVLEMWVLPSNLIEIIPDPEDVFGILGYRIDINGKRIPLRKNDIIHWRTFNPNFDAVTRAHLRGVSPLKAGKKIISQDEYSTDAAVAMYSNGGARGILFEKSLRNITPTQRAAIEDITSKRVNNRDLKSAVANLQGDWGYLDIGKDSIDMQLLEGQEKAFAKLCNLFGVPPGLFMIDQTYENMSSNRKRMLSELIIPDCASFNDEMNRQLLPAFGLNGYRIEPDYSGLPEMQEDMKTMITYLKDAPVTLNEIRSQLGYDPLPIDGMDMVYIDSNKMPVDGAGVLIPNGATL